MSADAAGAPVGPASAAGPTTGAALARTPLDALHRELGARMGAFAGYDMPIQYPAGIRAEHLHARAECALFDVSHMGQVRVSSADPSLADDIDSIGASLARALPLDFVDWAPGRQKYALLLDDAGGIEDDLMALRIDAALPEYRLVVNAANKAADVRRLRALCPELSFELLPDALVALQGPAAEAVLAAHDPSAADMAFMQGAHLSIAGVPCLATRSGYTGEDGWEISVPAADALRVARALLADARVVPAGLGARDTLRLEAGLPLHGSDIGPDTTPAEANLAWSIPKSRRTGGAQAGGFPGASTVLAQLAPAAGGAPERPAARRLCGLVSGSNVPIRAGTPILDAAGAEVGRVTSGTVSPTLSRPIALAYVQRATLEPGAQGADGGLVAAVRQQRVPVQVAPLPFVPKRYKR